MRIHEYSLIRDVVAAQQRPRIPQVRPAGWWGMMRLRGASRPGRGARRTCTPQLQRDAACHLSVYA